MFYFLEISRTFVFDGERPHEWQAVLGHGDDHQHPEVVPVVADAHLVAVPGDADVVEGKRGLRIGFSV